MSSDLDDGWLPPALADPDDEPAQEEDRTPAFHTPDEFVLEFLAPHIRRRLGGGFTWCAQWWSHEEAVSRIVALWTAFEHLRWEGPLGISTWWLHHADPHLAVLLSRDNGPFAACKPGKHTALDPLPCDPAPEGLWEAAGYTEPQQ